MVYNRLETHSLFGEIVIRYRRVNRNADVLLAELPLLAVDPPTISLAAIHTSHRGLETLRKGTRKLAT
jgi:hypothetical protein